MSGVESSLTAVASPESVDPRLVVAASLCRGARALLLHEHSDTAP
jgi:hypothetical protein